MNRIKNGGPDDLPQVEAKCPNDDWENSIRKYGVVNACEWFGHAADSDFTAETIRILGERGAQS